MSNAHDVKLQSDEALMEALQSVRSHGAFAELVRRHASRFRQLAFRHLSSKEEAEDIVQQAFLKLWENPHLWNLKRHVFFSTWFYRVVTNACIDSNRRRKPVELPEEEDFLSTDIAADIQLAENQQQQQVEQAFRALPLPMQTCLNLSYYDPIPNKAAAEIMGLSLKGYQSLLIRAKKAFKEKVMRQEHIKARHYESQ